MFSFFLSESVNHIKLISITMRYDCVVNWFNNDKIDKNSNENVTGRWKGGGSRKKDENCCKCKMFLKFLLFFRTFIWSTVGFWNFEMKFSSIFQYLRSPTGGSDQFSPSWNSRCPNRRRTYPTRKTGRSFYEIQMYDVQSFVCFGFTFLSTKKSFNKISCC